MDSTRPASAPQSRFVALLKRESTAQSIVGEIEDPLAVWLWQIGTLSDQAVSASSAGAEPGSEIDFDLWRQFTIKHLVGEDQGAYPPRIRAAVVARFGPPDGIRVVQPLPRFHEMKIVTGVSVLPQHDEPRPPPPSPGKIIAGLAADPEDALRALAEKLQEILDAKRAKVRVEALVGLSGLSTHDPTGPTRGPDGGSLPSLILVTFPDWMWRTRPRFQNPEGH